jgi:hypothetical protein
MPKAYLDITLTITGTDRAVVAAVYNLYKAPFLKTIKGALSKELLAHAEDIRILHGFDSVGNAQEYLLSDLFNNNVITSLRPCLKGEPDIKIYRVV